GTTYVYGTFFKPYISQHENEIDQNLLELRARKAASAGQSTFFDVLKYVVAQSPSQKSRQRLHQPPQQQQPQVQVQQAQPQNQAAPVMRRASSIAARQAAMAQQSQETKPVQSSPKIKRQTSARSGSVASTKPPIAASAPKPGGSPKKGEVKPAADPVQTPTT
ncbi:hypothetical protein ACJX0J_022994, partial [Zea mays]